MPPRESKFGQPKPLHPYAWLWEPLEPDPSFVLRAMFGTKAVYLDGKLLFCFSAKTAPWRGILLCTSREYQPSLLAEFPALAQHPILAKWLYLPETADPFERVGERLVTLAKLRDPRIGVVPPSRRRSHP
ncbi:MAG: hypothetical protein H7343_13400 [Undibacterium sp.]|nr:hypothetical protein [Opitutaceae bacterium]